MNRGGVTQILCRIKHYSNIGYHRAKKEIKKESFEREYNERLERKKTRLQNNKEHEEKKIESREQKEEKYKRLRQQKWCSFSIEKRFATANEVRLENFYEILSKFHRRVSNEWKPSQCFLDAVKQYGWYNLPRFYNRNKRAEYMRKAFSLYY